MSILRDVAHTVFMISTLTAPLRDLLALPGNQEVLQIFERIGIRDAASLAGRAPTAGGRGPEARHA